MTLPVALLEEEAEAEEEFSSPPSPPPTLAVELATLGEGDTDSCLDTESLKFAAHRSVPALASSEKKGAEASTSAILRALVSVHLRSSRALGPS